MLLALKLWYEQNKKLRHHWISSYQRSICYECICVQAFSCVSIFRRNRRSFSHKCILIILLQMFSTNRFAQGKLFGVSNACSENKTDLNFNKCQNMIQDFFVFSKTLKKPSMKKVRKLTKLFRKSDACIKRFDGEINTAIYIS